MKKSWRTWRKSVWLDTIAKKTHESYSTMTWYNVSANRKRDDWWKWWLMKQGTSSLKFSAQRSKLGEGRPWLMRSCFIMRALSLQTSFSLLSCWTSSWSCCIWSCLRLRLLRAARVFCRLRQSIFSCSVAFSGRGRSRASSSSSEYGWERGFLEVGDFRCALGGVTLSREADFSDWCRSAVWLVLYRSSEGCRRTNSSIESEEIDLEWGKEEAPGNIESRSVEAEVGDISNGAERE